MAERPHLLEQSQTAGIWGLALHAHAAWLPRQHTGQPLYQVTAGATVYGTLDDLEALARMILADVAAIRTAQGRDG